ncbi:PAS domain S-box-containing protein/diguanylate cyclase (GGDEF) domain-containing protein [Marinobacter persicus]|uniref:diguanylate cyclase n=1 Tax=Marinobacter persicus TaxID=930118 RepID=A0A1I3R9C3_9GAMM|nr:diguanylate cyclase [Marinobacter persicus]GHD43858.1 hypothetical protein GCM10008110_08260 [Marinobacter persicus]SFJ43234.1 PAS domain S-box-containing protein/diguanylate cyclase (GGDEF) domain-containing protein [Marinobacter persicus]
MNKKTSLARRLVVASASAVILVTLVITPIIISNISTRFESSRQTAETLLEGEYDALLQGLDESLNHTLALSEFPTVREYLTRTGSASSPYQEEWAFRNEMQLRGMLGTLLTHFGRYTRLTLIDTAGLERLSTGPSETIGTDHSNAPYFREAMVMENRALYLSVPYQSAVRGAQQPSYVIDIATPVLNADGSRLGVLVLTLSWDYLLGTLPHATGTNDNAHVWLTDAQGRWQLPDTQGLFGFGESLKDRRPAIWAAMERGNRGELLTGESILVFRTHDLRNDHFRSEARQVTSLPGTQPWRIAISVPRPDLTFLMLESPWKLSLIVVTYILAIGFGLFWVLSNHRQRSLKEEAHKLSKNARAYARELMDLYENAPCGYHSLDEQGVIQKINRTELQWLGYSKDEVVGKRYYRDLVSPETRAAFDEAFSAVLLSDEHEGSAEVELMRSNGDRFPAAIEASAQTDDDGFQYSRAMVFDLTERKQIEDLLTRQAMTDPLTGLGNRRFLESQAELEIARARRSGEPLMLIAADLDKFKRINDNHGHDVGDAVLQAFAKTAQNELRDGDVLCRMGGEEFTVLLPDTSKEQALMIAERLRVAVESAPVDVGEEGAADGYLRYTTSMGVTQVLPDEKTLKPAIKRADEALYQAKEAGRNRVCWGD